MGLTTSAAARTARTPAKPPSAGVSTRRLALDLLNDVLARGRPLDESLAERLAASALEPRDRAFARHLAATALRRLGQIDALIAAHLARPLPASEHAARNVLRLGAAQLLFLETPAHAAVNETVALAAAAAPRFKGLVNAVLRRLADGGKTRADAQDAARLNTPDWLWRAWSAAFGEAAARGIAAAHLAEPPLDFTLRAAVADWAKRLDADTLPTGTLRRRAGGLVSELPGYTEGAWWIQDAAAALPARLLGDRVGGVRGKRVIDLCAAPGGKTAQLAAAGAAVVAVEASVQRMKRLAENLARFKLEAELVAADAAAWTPAAPADAVLLDAPCSATGTIRRHPDLPRRKRAADLAGLAAAQDRLLANAATMVKPGGTLVYAVCSLQREEGPERVARLLAAQPGFALAPVAADEVGGVREFLRADGTVQTLPCHWPDQGGLDGFYIARLRRQ